MKVFYAWEHHGADTLLYAANVVGAYARGGSLEEALQKLPREIAACQRWQGEPEPDTVELVLVQEKESGLDIRDADSDLLLDAERPPLTAGEYEKLKALALRSAADFDALYAAIPDRRRSALPPRTTFYGPVPRTAEEMYLHTKGVNAYYFGEIGVDADNEGSILDCRARGFARLEETEGYLNNPVFSGSYGEDWTLRKVLRRFVWHDRIHAKAMCRMARKTFGISPPNPFCFDDETMKGRTD